MPYFVATMSNGAKYFEAVNRGDEIAPIIPIWQRGSDAIGKMRGFDGRMVAIQMRPGGGVTARDHDVLHGDYGAARETWEFQDDIKDISWEAPGTGEETDVSP